MDSENLPHYKAINHDFLCPQKGAWTMIYLPGTSQFLCQKKKKKRKFPQAQDEREEGYKVADISDDVVALKILRHVAMYG